MKITIDNKEIELKYSFRAMMIYEKITGASFNPKGMTEIMIYFYSTILASSRDIDLTFDSFVDWIDDNPKSLSDFSNWLTSMLSKNSVLNDGSEGANEESFKKN